MTKLLTHAEVKARLRIGRNGVYDLAKRREISVTRIGGRLFFPEDEVEAFIQRNTIPARRAFFKPRNIAHA